MGIEIVEEYAEVFGGLGFRVVPLTKRDGGGVVPVTVPYEDMGGSMGPLAHSGFERLEA